ncbi:MAG: hypothetical protein GWM98_29475, partial [Nitrospinaceae bacterium]|nr:hypothetical protein [Nitrospinaceae bacterium]NIU46680.1 hypothetical protein [Nitrospinaceae bacterium]NIY18693.1 hypothetical protein [Nitrospinaceae bacterium]
APLEVAAELAEQLEGLRHSRDMEAQADRRGLTLLFDADIDPAGMIQIYEKFARLEKPPAAVPPREETDADSSPET